MASTKHVCTIIYENSPTEKYFMFYIFWVWAVLEVRTYGSKQKQMYMFIFVMYFIIEKVQRLRLWKMLVLKYLNK